MDANSNLDQTIKTSPPSSPVEINIGENIVIDENTEILTLNNDSNIQLEIFDVKNISQDELLVNNSRSVEDENNRLKKELSMIQEKFSILHSQVQNQSKLIELLVRLDMVNSDSEPDKKELEDLHRKITLCYNLVEECSVKYNELCNQKRRFLIANNNELEKKTSAIWDHFTVSSISEGQKIAECNYCGKSFNYKHLNANKCRDHIYDKCDKAPEDIKSNNKPRYEQSKKSKYTVWNYFTNTTKNDKNIISCIYCGIEYLSKNATKCREHLAFKCQKIPEDVRNQMRSTFSQEYISMLNSNKKSSIWEHFSIVEDEDKTVIQCLYCCMNYANKNATKCREHLLDRCEKIPLEIRHKINNSFFESPLKTWTQIKIPIWKHFSIITDDDKKNYKCNYCRKIYTSKNVTKFRTHLLCKCDNIPDSVKQCLTVEVSRSGSKKPSEELEFLCDDETNDPDYHLETQQKLVESNVVYEDEEITENESFEENTEAASVEVHENVSEFSDGIGLRKAKRLRGVKVEID